MGAVELTSKACVAVMTGKPIARGSELLRFLALDGKGDGTANQDYMAGGALLSSLDAEIRCRAERKIDQLLTAEELGGPTVWEVLCPDPHSGMYALAWAAVMFYGHELGARAAVILGQMLRLGDE